MNRFFQIVKLVLFCLLLQVAISAIYFTNVGAEDGLVEANNSSLLESEPEPVYTYNETTGLWDSNMWYYDPVSESYQPAQVSNNVINSQVEDDLGSNFATEQDESLSEFASEENIDNNIGVNNTIESDATTGDALVSTNTEAGSALSGDADSTATVLNNVNTVTSLNGANGVATFSADVVGDVSGDIVLQPIVSQTLDNPITPIDTTTNLTNVTGITNNINLNADSGDATVMKNTKAGDAVTGSAETVANIINIVNSMVVAGQSFIGAINIYGNFIGDILISPDFVPQILASNNGDDINPQSIIVNNDDTTKIINNLSLSATSGQALVAGNSQAGSAISGDALTNIVIFNMTGREIIANNCLLLFINVLGEWYGVIVDAPIGSTAAIIGNDVESNAVYSPNIDASINNEVEITNNIALSSQSGDASVVGNTLAGSAITGDATASVNLANIVGSRFSLSGWFGILFINVFGKWFGNFGVEIVPPAVVVDDDVVSPVIDFIPNNNQAASYQSARVLGITRTSDDMQAIGAENEATEVAPTGIVLGASDNEISSSIDYVWMLLFVVVVLITILMSWLEIYKSLQIKKA